MPSRHLPVLRNICHASHADHRQFADFVICRQPGEQEGIRDMRAQVGRDTGGKLSNLRPDCHYLINTACVFGRGRHHPCTCFGSLEFTFGHLRTSKWHRLKELYGGGGIINQNCSHFLVLQHNRSNSVILAATTGRAESVRMVPYSSCDSRTHQESEVFFTAQTHRKPTLVQIHHRVSRNTSISIFLATIRNNYGLVTNWGAPYQPAMIS